MNKIEIKNRWTGNTIFEYEKENNTIRETLEKAVKEGAYLTGADLSDANLSGADLRDADLSSANLRDADLRDANLRDADLRGSNLRGADLRDADLRDADLSSADLSSANLRDADLRGSNLRGADLRDADLSSADLSSANLRGADLRGANLRGADLRDADLRGAYLYVSDEDINQSETIKEFENNANIKIIESYINHDIRPTRWNYFWKNGLIIRKWEVKPKAKEMTIEEMQNKIINTEDPIEHLIEQHKKNKRTSKSGK